MKILFLLFIILPFGVFAQKKFDNRISVPGINLRDVKKALAEQHFFLANSDEENQTCFTAPKSMPDSTGWPTANIRFFVQITGSMAIFSAKVDLPNAGDNLEVSFRGVKNGLSKKAFLYLDSFAKSFGKTVRYSRE